MRKTESRNVFFQLFGSRFLSKPVRIAEDKKELTTLGKRRMLKTHNRMYIQPKI